MSLVRSLLKAAPQQASRRAYSAASPFPQVNKGFVPMFAEAPVKESDIVAKYLRDTAWSQERAALEGHAPEATALWRRVTLFVALPTVLITSIFVYKKEAEHNAHIDHEIEHNGGKAPKRVIYDYMNRRLKPLPWAGNQSLFFSPRYNIQAPLEFGGEYEEDEE